MTFTHKLARRLAIIRSLAMVPLFLAAAALTGCLDQIASSTFDPASTGGSTELEPVALAPETMTLETSQKAQFQATVGGKWSEPVDWSADGGEITQSGVFAAERPGTYHVLGRRRGRDLPPDTATVIVVAPQSTLEHVVVEPGQVEMHAAQEQKFLASGILRGGSHAALGVVWSATGGSIDAGGDYRAPDRTGNFLVIARNTSGTKADTSLVNVSASAGYPESPAGNPDTTAKTDPQTPSNPVTPGNPPTAGNPRPSLPVIPGQIDWSHPAGTLPTQASALVALDLVGPTLTATQSAAQGGMFNTYESRWIQFAQRQWQSEGAAWSGDYYDRALNFYALWIRTGDATWRNRADQIAVGYRTQYLEANNYSSSPHWSQLEGVFLHYWLTGDAKSRAAVVNVAGKLSIFLNSSPSYKYQEGRIQARAMMASLLSCLIKDTSRDWCGQADRFIDDWVNLQQPDGSFRYRLSTEDPNSPMGQSNFMEGLRADAAIKYYYLRRQDPRILTMVARMADYMSTEWNPSAGTFKYHSVDPTAAPSLADLNHLIVEMFGFAYKTTGQQKYKAIGDAAFDAGEPGWTPAYVASGHGEFLTESKQYNEHYYSSFRYLAFRQ